MTHAFIGRENELEKLQRVYRRKTPSLAVIKGRRRVGKSRLINEFANQSPKSRLWSFAGLAPQTGMTAQDQRDHFAKQFCSQSSTPQMAFNDWSDAFNYFSQHIIKGDIVLFDEISWMGAKDPSFIPKIKAWWDQQKISFTLVFCGSVSTWIEENILNNTAFFGRIHLIMTVEPLNIPESLSLLKEVGFQGSAYDSYKLISILGGIPWYLEQAQVGFTADSLIQQLCFEKEGLLVSEFDRIFHDLFNTKGNTYKLILKALESGMKSLAEVRQAIDFPHSGTLSKLMEQLITAGFVKKQQLWSFKTQKPLKQSLYRISDPYIRFYLKVIEKERHKIELGGFSDTSLSQLNGFEAHLGLQIELLLLQNRQLLLKSLGIPVSDVIADGPYRQSKTKTHKGCQIDYLVQTQTNTLFICEFKFKRREIGSAIIDSMKEKIHALKVPKGFATIPVLFHIGGVSTTVATDSYFYRIIDIADFLENIPNVIEKW